MHLIVIRHGETVMNIDERLQGRRGPDEPLTEHGRNETALLREGLHDTPTTIYCSTLRRAIETATILNERFQVPVIAREELCERDFGILSGAYKKDVADIIRSDNETGIYDYRPYGGESIDNVTSRIKAFLSSLPLASDDTVFVVTHRGIIRALYGLYPTLPRPDDVLLSSTHHFAITELP